MQLNVHYLLSLGDSSLHKDSENVHRVWNLQSFGGLVGLGGSPFNIIFPFQALDLELV